MREDGHDAPQWIIDLELKLFVGNEQKACAAIVWATVVRLAQSLANCNGSEGMAVCVIQGYNWLGELSDAVLLSESFQFQ
ncbi:hypothetical protein Pla8534_10430 [Lignipirellula cremea]|uniref:Uncharacterized protein n=1 Tax=Lignipirellula cremea TaxID=2528010 RepID=A0A518DN46_9BACT|nr:hypothetical protein Pla8534_10430 [Lignipirellula cremea]